MATRSRRRDVTGRREGIVVPVDIGLYTKIPSKFFGSGMASSLRTSASLFYLALFEHANRNASSTFKASDAALASETGLAPRTISDARKRLMEYGLIRCTREAGQSHRYTMVEQKLDWKPLKQRLRRKLKPRALHGTRTVQV
jgi:hypothetical protein